MVNRLAWKSTGHKITFYPLTVKGIIILEAKE